MRSPIALAVVAFSVAACTPVKGDTGPKGDTGARAQGPKGDTGSQGAAGSAGEPGAPGMVGPQGGGKYVTNRDIYCHAVRGAAVSGVDGAAVSASCDAREDLGLSGSCYGNFGGSLGFDLYLSESKQVGWEVGVTAPAAWTCGWTFREGVTSRALPNATAEICCIKG